MDSFSVQHNTRALFMKILGIFTILVSIIYIISADGEIINEKDLNT